MACACHGAHGAYLLLLGGLESKSMALCRLSRAASKPVLLSASLCQLQPALPELDLLGSACFLRDCSPLPLLLETERCSVLFFNFCRLFWTRA